MGSGRGCLGPWLGNLVEGSALCRLPGGGSAEDYSCSRGRSPNKRSLNFTSLMGPAMNKLLGLLPY